MSSGANDQAKVLQFAAFRDHGWGHVAVYSSSHNQTQPSHNGGIQTAKELSEIF